MSKRITVKMVRDPKCPPEILKMVLERGKDNDVSRYAARNRNCSPQARINWLIATGRIKMPDLSKHDVQVIRDNRKPDEAWEQLKAMVEDE